MSDRTPYVPEPRAFPPRATLTEKMEIHLSGEVPVWAADLYERNLQILRSHMTKMTDDVPPSVA
jgi:hypothetical protein